MLKEWLVIWEGKQKSFNLNYLEKENNIILEEIKKWIKPNEKKINILVFHLFLQEFALSYWEDQLDYELNQDKSFQETLFYIWNKEELKKLYSKLTWKEILQEKPLFFKKEWILKYWDKSIEFELYKLPYYLLCVIFEDEKNNWIDINDFNDYLISKQYNHSVEYEQMKNALKNINRRFKSKFKISKLLLVSNGKAIFKSKWLIL
jgi:hypothetical protein